MNETLRACQAVIARDIRLTLARGGEAVQPLVFFILVAALFPLGVGPGPDTLRSIAPGVIWVGALLATLLGTDRLFRGDLEDGSLEQLMLTPHPLVLLALAKVAAHWLVTGLPLLLVAPVVGVLYGLPGSAYPALLASLAVGTPALSLLAAVGAALTVSLRQGGVLLSILVLPLLVPALIFGAGALAKAMVGLSWSGELALLGALLALALISAPPAIAAGLRISVEA